MPTPGAAAPLFAKTVEDSTNDVEVDGAVPPEWIALAEIGQVRYEATERRLRVRFFTQQVTPPTCLSGKRCSVSWNIVGESQRGQFGINVSDGIGGSAAPNAMIADGVEREECDRKLRWRAYPDDGHTAVSAPLRCLPNVRRIPVWAYMVVNYPDGRDFVTATDYVDWTTIRLRA